MAIETLAAEFLRGSATRMRRFIWHQLSDVSQGGVATLCSKFGQLALILVLSPLALVFWLLERWVVVRFAPMYSERIGHFAANTEIYLCEREAGINVPQPRSFDVLYYRLPASNSQLKRMWDRTLRIWPWALAYPLHRASRLLPRAGTHEIRMPHGRDIHGLLARTKPHLAFTKEEEQIGWEKIRKLGVPQGIPFVCFHARDSAYLNTVYPHLDCSYHDHRDSNIHNYLVAVDLLTKRGYYAIRMGSLVKDSITTDNSKIIDYATNGFRSEFLDVFLGANCRFFISSGTGVDAIPMIFRRQIVYVNIVPLEYVTTWLPDHLFIPKKHWLKEDHRFMSFKEILKSGAGRFLDSKDFVARGIELIENTAEEIAAVVREMDERLRGAWTDTEEDDELQCRFWALFKRSELNGVFLSRIGSDFLRMNRELMD